MNTILLDLLAFGSVLSGILVITSRNPIISVLFLIAVFVNVACYLILLGINFIGITYLIIYVGAIAILFLFVVMMINVKLVEIHQSTIHWTQHLPLALMIGTAFFMTFNQITESKLSLLNLFDSLNSLVYGLHLDRTELIFGNLFTIGKFLPPDNSFIQFSQVESIGNLMYTSHMFWIFLLSMVLLLAMCGPIILTHKPTRATFRLI